VQIALAQPPEVLAVDGDGAGFDIGKPQQEFGYGGLASTAWPHQPDLFTGLDG
jgi:hypothetical protein